MDRIRFDYHPRCNASCLWTLAALLLAGCAFFLVAQPYHWTVAHEVQEIRYQLGITLETLQLGLLVMGGFLAGVSLAGISRFAALLKGRRTLSVTNEAVILSKDRRAVAGSLVIPFGDIVNVDLVGHRGQRQIVVRHRRGCLRLSQNCFPGEQSFALVLRMLFANQTVRG